MYINKAIQDIEQATSVDLKDLYDQYPVRIGDICDRIGIEVIFEEEMEEDFYGNIQYTDGKYIIRVNPSHSMHNNVFTIAHELGHFIKHKQDVITRGFADRKKTKYNPQETRKEQEANAFAANLLMPQDKFTDMFYAAEGNVMLLQKIFRVSSAAIKYRAINLGLLLG